MLILILLLVELASSGVNRVVSVEAAHEPVATQASGRSLSRRDALSLGSPAEPLAVTPLAKFLDAPYSFMPGRLVAVCEHFVVYLVKDPVLRVIDLRTGERGLIRVATALTDCVFAAPDRSVLACADRKGNVSLWNITRSESNAVKCAPRIASIYFRIILYQRCAGISRFLCSASAFPARLAPDKARRTSCCLI